MPQIAVASAASSAAPTSSHVHNDVARASTGALPLYLAASGVVDAGIRSAGAVTAAGIGVKVSAGEFAGAGAVDAAGVATGSVMPATAGAGGTIAAPAIAGGKAPIKRSAALTRNERLTSSFSNCVILCWRSSKPDVRSSMSSVNWRMRNSARSASVVAGRTVKPSPKDNFRRGPPSVEGAVRVG